MKNQLFVNQSSEREGVYTPIVEQNIVLIRFANYTRKNWNNDPSNLSQEQRFIACYVLQEYFALRQKDISQLLHVSRITVYKDKNSATFMYKNLKSFQEKCNKLRDYIYYFSKYLTTV